MKKQICKNALKAMAIVVLVTLSVTLFVSCDTAAETATKYYSNSIIDQYEWKFVGQEVSEAGAAYRGECTYYKNGELKKIELFGLTEWIKDETLVLEFDKSGKIIGGTYAYVLGEENVSETIEPTYDKKGNCIKVEYIDGDNTVRGYSEYEYDESNNCISRKMYNCGSLIYRYVYECDQNGNRTKVICYNEKNDKSSEIDFVFDENNNCIKRTNIFYADDGTISRQEATELDENGTETKKTTYNSDGSVKNWREYEYDENGEWIKYTLYNADGTINNIHQYNFDENGNQIGYVIYDNQGNITSQEETDQNGNTISSSYKNGKLSSQYVRDKNHNTLKSVNYDSDGKMIIWIQYEYDENGNRIKSERYNADGTIDYWSEYENDEKGNRIKEISYDADGKISDHSEYSSVDQNLIKRVTYGNDEKVRWIYVYEYNSAGEQSKELLYNADNELYEYTIYGQGTDGRIDKTYNADDVLVRTDEWKAGDREGSRYVALSTEFYPNGSIKYTSEWLRNPDRMIDTYYYENGNIQNITEYDENWEIVKETNYDINGKVIEAAGGSSSGGKGSVSDPNTHFEYDANGNIIKMTVTNDRGQITNICNFGEDGKEVSQIIYSYYDNGKVSKSTEEIRGVGSTRIEYYENGNKKQEATFNASGNPLVIITYDENGNVTSTIDRTGNE